MRRVTPFIPSSLETCAPPLEGAYVRTPTTHVARGHARPVRTSNGVRAPRPSAPHEPPRLRPPSAPPRRSRPPLRAPRDVCAHGSRSRPTACVPLEYKFIKIVVHSTTWASRPSTTVRWMTAGCLGGDHSFLIHFHGPRAHPQTRLYACLI
jgi:hypothetical protein